MSDRLRFLAERYGVPDGGIVELESLVEQLVSQRRAELAQGVHSSETMALGTRLHTTDTLKLSDTERLEHILPTGDKPGDTHQPGYLGSRYEDLGELGQGAMGEVRLVRDLSLNRNVAMKIMRIGKQHSAASVARFVEEAQATSQLQHPNIVPVHEMGRLDDGRIYFTMKVVRGDVFGRVIADMHRSQRGVVGTTRGRTLRQVISFFHQVCSAIAYAHSRGVIHRDLKPSNVMIDSLDEVYVVDWGLAKVVGRPDVIADLVDLSPVRSLRTRFGTVAGTPAFMPPEQARGEIDAIDARSDVYALGALLYSILRGRPPYTGDDVLGQVLAGPPPPVDVSSDGVRLRGVPPALVSLCHNAMARDPQQRPADAQVLANEVSAWLEGLAQRERALAFVRRADEIGQQTRIDRSVADARLRQARAVLANLHPWSEVARKVPAWELEDYAQRAIREVEAGDHERETLLRMALAQDADLASAHLALAELYRERHEAAEASGDRPDPRLEIEMRLHAEALPDTMSQRGRILTYLRGLGALSIAVEPPDATIELHRYVRVARRLQLRHHADLQGPLDRYPLAMGRWALKIRAPGHHEVIYPVMITRQEHWHARAPGDPSSTAVRLLAHAELGEDECYVPGGFAWTGGSRDRELPRRRLWIDSFVIQKYMVTQRDYIAFLDDLVAQGREDEALRAVPRERKHGPGEQGVPLYGRNARGGFELREDEDGDYWQPDWPAFMLDWISMVRYAEWLSEKSGLNWRLPCELEWEKAAAGVDGRAFPWGDHFDANWCRMTRSSAGRVTPCAVDGVPEDISPYGVIGMAGNAAEWCRDLYHDSGPKVVDGRLIIEPANLDERASAMRSARGGNFGSGESVCRAAYRQQYNPKSRVASQGFRLVRSVD